MGGKRAKHRKCEYMTFKIKVDHILFNVIYHCVSFPVSIVSQEIIVMLLHARLVSSRCAVVAKCRRSTRIPLTCCHKRALHHNLPDCSDFAIHDVSGISRKYVMCHCLFCNSFCGCFLLGYLSRFGFCNRLPFYDFFCSCFCSCFLCCHLGCFPFFQCFFSCGLCRLSCCFLPRKFFGGSFSFCPCQCCQCSCFRVGSFKDNNLCFTLIFFCVFLECNCCFLTDNASNTIIYCSTAPK
mmetsp:Transcript_138019/g.253881  ORF Transcript_138019/g.253881 Transcript_138019/m.253881 type:complete len:238 (-) Transcript_138019:1396-2109(-)